MNTAKKQKSLLLSFAALTCLLGVSSDVNAQSLPEFGVLELTDSMCQNDFPAETCPIAFSKPATPGEVLCHACHRQSRCTGAITSSECFEFNSLALNHNSPLIDNDAFFVLNVFGYCAISVGDYLGAICPSASAKGNTELPTLPPDEIEEKMLPCDTSKQDTLASLTNLP